MFWGCLWKSLPHTCLKKVSIIVKVRWGGSYKSENCSNISWQYSSKIFSGSLSLFFRAGLWQNGFFADFIFGQPDFFADFVAGFFLLIFCEKKCPEKSSKKIPSKILQQLHNKIPDTFLQRVRANTFGKLVTIFTWKLVSRTSKQVSRNLGPLWPGVSNDTNLKDSLRILHAQYDWMAGVPDNGDEWRKFRAVPRLYPLRFLVLSCLIGVETEGLLDYQGRAGIISIAQWNLCPVIVGVDIPSA